MNRRTFLTHAAALGLGTTALAVARGPLRAMKLSDTGTIVPLEKSAKEWKEILDRDAYYVLFREGTERPFSSPLNDEKRAGTFVCCRVLPAALLLEDEVRQRHRLAKLLGAARRRCRHEARLQARAPTHRIPLCPLRRPPGACLQ